MLSREEFYNEKKKNLNRIRRGDVFIYPTDTIYGIGCDAGNDKSIKRIYDLKERQDKPFSVIAPSKEWIIKNCNIDEISSSWINRLPGRYTLILRLKNKKCISKLVNKGMGTIGVRIPKHWISDVVNELGIPIVTTSVNRSDKEFMTSVENMDKYIKENVDFIIYEGDKNNRPSEIIDLSKGNAMVEER